jgi:hypothetical protein
VSQHLLVANPFSTFFSTKGFFEQQERFSGGANGS